MHAIITTIYLTMGIFCLVVTICQRSTTCLDANDTGLYRNVIQFGPPFLTLLLSLFNVQEDGPFTEIIHYFRWVIIVSSFDEDFVAV